MENTSFRVESINAKNNCFSSKETPIINPYTEIYYARSNVGVPFLWESQPGTPKIKNYDRSLPPLTPPPSFIYSSKSRKPLMKPSKANILNLILPKLIFRKASRAFLENSSSSSSCSSSHSVPGSPGSLSYRRGHAMQPSMRWFFGEDECRSPNSTLCFGVRCGLSGRPRMSSSNRMNVLSES